MSLQVTSLIKCFLHFYWAVFCMNSLTSHRRNHHHLLSYCFRVICFPVQYQRYRLWYISSTSLSFPTRKYNEVRTGLRKKRRPCGIAKVEGRTGLPELNGIAKSWRPYGSTKKNEVRTEVEVRTGFTKNEVRTEVEEVWKLKSVRDNVTTWTVKK